MPGIPLIAKFENFNDRTWIRIAGLRTFDTSASKALRRAEKYLKPVRKDVKNRRCRELLKLSETRPEFYDHPWIREEIFKWDRTGRSFTKRGRKFGTFGTHPLIVVAAVEEVMARQWASKKDPAFVWLAEHDWLEYETVKKQYYQALDEYRFRAVLIQNSIWSTPKPRLKARRMIRSADRLRPGHSVTRTLLESPMGALTVTITAK